LEVLVVSYAMVASKPGRPSTIFGGARTAAEYDPFIVPRSFLYAIEATSKDCL